MTSTRQSRPAIAAMYTGLALTLVATIAVYIDHTGANVLAAHIKAGYPSFSQALIDEAAMTYLIYLSILGGLGALAWLSSIWAAHKAKSWTRWLATAWFALGASIAVFNLLIKDTSGDTGLPPLLGWAGMLPSLAGLAAVVLVWRKK